ncbi:MAG: hypothetical protein E7L01_19735, partial [Paenibacillus macerans]|nr:hypothetical protein [Paenibacillus macerans]
MNAHIGEQTAAPLALEVRHIHKTFRERRKEVPVLRDISLEVRAGEISRRTGTSLRRSRNV